MAGFGGLRVSRGWRVFLLTGAALAAAGIGCNGEPHSPSDPGGPSEPAICGGKPECNARNQRIATIRPLQPSGARPHWSPDGELLCFDRKNADGYYDVYLCNLSGAIVRSVTDGRPGIGRKNNGNAVFEPSGRYVIFISENEEHLFDDIPEVGDPGVGLYSDLWAADLETGTFNRLTSYPIKQTLTDQLPSMAAVNPGFSRDGARLIWTERYDEGGHFNWGRWRIKIAEFIVADGVPRLADERVFFTPATGNYVTLVGEAEDGTFLLAGNLDGQHEYGMDIYRWSSSSGSLMNLTATPAFWEEDVSTSPSGAIVYMSNMDSRVALDFRRNWTGQPVEREYYMMNMDGGAKERLTFFNEPGAPEHARNRTLVAASDFSPNGQYLAGTIGLDLAGDDARANVQLGVVLIEFR